MRLRRLRATLFRWATDAVGIAVAAIATMVGSACTLLYPVNEKNGPSGPAPSNSGMFLGLSFQGLHLEDEVRPRWCDIVGPDSVYGMTSPRYPAGLWGGTAGARDSIQLVYDTPGDQTRQIVTDTTVPNGVSNQVIELTFVNSYID